MEEVTLDMHNYPADAKQVSRKAVRGIVRRGDRYLMIYSRKYGDCKFPGGGQESGETNLETLIREVREETGYDVLPDSVREYLLVHERRRGMMHDLMCMDSSYYFCEVGDEVHPQDLQDYEIDEAYEVLWLTPAEAIARNEKANPEIAVWAARETFVLRRLAENEEPI